MTLVPINQEYEYDHLLSPNRWTPHRIVTTWSFVDPGYFRLGINFKPKLKRLLRVERLRSVDYVHVENMYYQERGFIEITYAGRRSDRVFAYFQKLARDSSGTMLDISGSIEGKGVCYKFKVAWLHSMSSTLLEYLSCWYRKIYEFKIRFYIHEALKQT